MTDPNKPLPYADDVETIPVDEAEDTQQVIQALELILARSQAKSGQFLGDVHVKTHGYAQGELRVPPNLPDELAQGLFGHDGVYPAVVRFSNAASQCPVRCCSGRTRYGDQGAGRGRRRGVGRRTARPGEDFVMINHPVFFARNVKDYLRLEQVLVQADDKPLATLQAGLTGGDWNPLHWHWREMLAVAQIAGQANPLRQHDLRDGVHRGGGRNLPPDRRQGNRGRPPSSTPDGTSMCTSSDGKHKLPRNRTSRRRARTRT